MSLTVLLINEEREE